MVIADESSTEESKSEGVHKIINEEKYAVDETYYEEPLVTGNTFIKGPRYFNLFNSGQIS